MRRLITFEAIQRKKEAIFDRRSTALIKRRSLMSRTKSGAGTGTTRTVLYTQFQCIYSSARAYVCSMRLWPIKDKIWRINCRARFLDCSAYANTRFASNFSDSIRRAQTSTCNATCTSSIQHNTRTTRKGHKKFMRGDR